MRVSIPSETAANERRVAAVPDTVARLIKLGFEVVVQSRAGLNAGHRDSAYREAGATIAEDARQTCAGAGVILKVREPRFSEDLGADEIELYPEGCLLIGFLNGGRDDELIRRLAARRMTDFAMELIPRISRAQKMDALSSMSNVAGYKAALVAANSLTKFFPLLMTAAGTVAPAHVFVLGAGVAGLQAIATSRRLGAVVEAFDVRPAVAEEVQSLGATFVSLDITKAEQADAGGYAKEMSDDEQSREREMIHQHVAAADVVISTANVPGRRAPVLITREMVESMRPGSVIVDLAAESGGNCELTEAGAEICHADVTIHGTLNLAATVPTHASQLYSRNVLALLQHMVDDGSIKLDFEDEIVRDTCITHQGRTGDSIFTQRDTEEAVPSG
jgi:NAD(P) transhydrogenase subunit alpha